MQESRPILVVHPGAEMYGSDRVLLDSVIGLRMTGRAVVVVLPMDGPLAAELRRAGASVKFEPAFVLRKRLLKPTGWAEAVRTGWGGFRSARRILRALKPSAILVNTITLPLWPLIGRMHGVPVILHVHEGEASASAIVKRALYAPALAASSILVNSEFSRRVMTSAFASLEKKSTLVPNAVPGPPAVRSPRASVSDGLRAVYIGRLSPRKGPDLVVQALAELDSRGLSFSLTLVGSAFEGYEWYEAELRTAVSAAGLDGRVTLVGFHSDVWPFLAEADVVVVPSRFDEPFGNTAVEAVLAERPVVVSDTSGLREATEGVSTALRVKADSAEAVADGLEQVWRDWEGIRPRLESTRKLTEDRHSPRRYRERLAEAVSCQIDIASEHPASRAPRHL